MLQGLSESESFVFGLLVHGMIIVLVFDHGVREQQK